MKRIVIGTAGHIDHGKTNLIKALTGIDCDRLKEEKERGITTELGFAHYRFGNDLLVGIVDVPGHEKFVRHMVAGAWGIDMVLLVVAADEGVMPQTREHMDICELLGLTRGVVAVTKKDLVDEEMLELVTEDINDFLKNRPLEGAPLIHVSSTTGENIELLKNTIEDISGTLFEKPKQGIFRLPIDRVFSLKGLGTIVTGTCISGSIKNGEEIEIYPTGVKARIRNIQAYHIDAEEAMAGERVALNIQGIEKTEIERGSIIGRPSTLTLSNRVDAIFKYLKLPFKAIKHDSLLRFHIAATQVEARLVLLNQDFIEPGEEIFAQFVFANPMVTLPEDRFVIRGSYAIQTIGGGTILDISPNRHKRKTPSVASSYEILLNGSQNDKILYHLTKGGYEGLTKKRISTLMGNDERKTELSLNELLKGQQIKIIGKYIIHMDKFAHYKELLKERVSRFHEKNPFKIGLSKEELRTKLPKVNIQTFQFALDETTREGFVEIDKDKVKRRGLNTSADDTISTIKKEVLLKLKHYGLTPPSVKEIAEDLKQRENLLKDVLEGLVHEGKVIKAKGDLFFHGDTIKEVKETVLCHLLDKKEMSPSDFKGYFDVSRKYMIPILEYLDEIKLTIRVGDKRILRS